ncbi:helix-turn-helix domain-containing protein [Streptomyces sp. IMTB 1903]|uniref:helix-turn-helix domain-containing protein n=1 Tax=Streptomyces sp. IMTB 1903 TaxID=1776680 RepID=UPI000757BFF1|nr:helix-turn-helix transcriptional regulator [Streptomyces sp. IMTB 1903]
MPALRFNPDALRQIRRQRGVTQRALAVEIGRDFTTISHYESGRYAPSVGTLSSIAAALGARMDDFIARTEVAA